MNLDFFRDQSDVYFSIDYSGKGITSYNKFITLLGNSSELIVFLGTPAIDLFRREIEKLARSYRCFFIVDPYDISLKDFPIPNLDIQGWAAPHILNPSMSNALCLPVGVTNRWMWQYGRPSLFDYESKKSKWILSGPFGQTHYDRLTFNSRFNSPYIDAFDTRLRPSRYHALARDYRFVICPRGNGIDTHRLWESLYRGSVPIVEKSPWSQYFANLDIPLMEINHFEELNDLDQSDLEAKYLEKEFVPALKPVLWPRYWIDVIRHFRSSSQLS